MPNPQIIDQLGGIDGESDIFVKHRKYTVALSYVFFVIAIIWVLGIYRSLCFSAGSQLGYIFDCMRARRDW